MSNDVDIQNLRQWIGRSEEAQDTVTDVPIKALACLFDHESSELMVRHSLRPCWHWLYFLPLHRHSHLGDDGHPARGGFLPPVPLPRRMWAGSQLTFEAPIDVGQKLTRVSRIADVRFSLGRSGPLVFVQVKHMIHSEGRICILETQDIVYRDEPPRPHPTGPQPADPSGEPAPPAFDWSKEVTPDEAMLFRYSALTFNGHRIHYDRTYAMDVEGYPGLVVHGPLIATLLLELFAHHMPKARVTAFSFKARKPLFDTTPFLLRGFRKGVHSADLWAVTPQGETAMSAEVEFT